MMHEREKSDIAVVAVKLANKAERSAAELVEPRAGTEGNAGQHSTYRAQYRASVSPALERIRHVRRQTPKVGAVCGKSRSYGSVRGVLSNERPYRDQELPRNDELRRFGRPLHVIASAAKQSRVTHAAWIAASQGLLAMTHTDGVP
jgi:hypothetical protein